jgi:hypothetical protein
MKSKSGANHSPSASERRVFIALPLRERDRVRLRCEALNAGLHLTQLIRQKLGLPVALGGPERAQRRSA